MAVRNRYPATIHYGTTQRYDLVIRDQSGKKIWQYSDGKAFLQIIGKANTASFDIPVPLDQLPGKSIAPGLYTLDAWLTTAGVNPRFAASITVLVGDFGQPPLALSGAVNRSVMRGRGGLPIPGRSQRY